MARLTQKTELIKHMTTDELSAFRKLLEKRIAGHVYRANDATTFKTPIKAHHHNAQRSHPAAPL